MRLEMIGVSDKLSVIPAAGRGRDARRGMRPPQPSVLRGIAQVFLAVQRLAAAGTVRDAAMAKTRARRSSSS